MKPLIMDCSCGARVRVSLKRYKTATCARCNVSLTKPLSDHIVHVYNLAKWAGDIEHAKELEPLFVEITNALFGSGAFRAEDSVKRGRV